MASLSCALKVCSKALVRDILTINKRWISKSKVSMFLDLRNKDHEKKCKELVVRQTEFFDEVAGSVKTKETFQEAVDLYLKRNIQNRRGHVEFLYAALERIDEFKAQRDVETYRQLLEVFPKYIMKARTTWEVEFMHYPKQQQCCIDILDHMEKNGVIPDDELGHQLKDLFGVKSHAFRKYQRMMYWMPKFKYANPYYVPYDLPEDGIELAKLALTRMKVDLENEISVYQTDLLNTSVDKTYVVSAQSPEQRRLLSELPREEALYVEGWHLTWLRMVPLKYFVLKSNSAANYNNFISSHKKFDYKNVDDNEDMTIYTYDHEPRQSKAVAKRPSCHEQDDGIVLAMCITGSSSKDSLASWIKFLEDSNPSLADTPVLFLLKSLGNDVEACDDNKAKDNSK